MQNLFRRRDFWIAIISVVLIVNWSIMLYKFEWDWFRFVAVTFMFVVLCMSVIKLMLNRKMLRKIVDGRSRLEVLIRQKSFIRSFILFSLLMVFGGIDFVRNNCSFGKVQVAGFAFGVIVMVVLLYFAFVYR